jgi:cell division protein FtsQ
MEWLHEAAVLTAPDETYVRGRSAPRRALGRAHRRDFAEDFADGEVDGGYDRGRRRTGLRLTFRGGLPESVWGRVAAGAALLAILGLTWGAAVMARRMVLRDERFLLQSSSSVLTEGNHHVSRADLLEVFGADIERNILRVSLDDRRAELEQIPWVQHATVMRLLPDRIRVAVQERTPVAFVREGGHIGLVDASGVLLSMGADQVEDRSYSFPVVTGISAADPVSVRAARMKIFHDFTRDLDATGESISAKLSEIDLSHPEDVKALIPDHGSDVLVHFGDRDYLARYRKYVAHLPEWRTQYPKLSSVDMRYERQVVLEMQPGTAVPVAGTASQETDASPSALPKKSRVATRLTPNVPTKQRAAQATNHVHALKKAGHP